MAEMRRARSTKSACFAAGPESNLSCSRDFLKNRPRTARNGTLKRMINARWMRLVRSVCVYTLKRACESIDILLFDRIDNLSSFIMIEYYCGRLSYNEINDKILFLYILW